MSSVQFTLLNKPHFERGYFQLVWTGAKKRRSELYACCLPSISFDLNLVSRVLQWGRSWKRGWLALTQDCSVLNLSFPSSYSILNIDFIFYHSSAETQTKREQDPATAHDLHERTDTKTGAWIPSKRVHHSLQAIWARSLPQPDWNPSKNMVPEPQSERQAPREGTNGSTAENSKLRRWSGDHLSVILLQLLLPPLLQEQSRHAPGA